MKELLRGYVPTFDKNKNQEHILLLLNELRIMNINQLTYFVNLEYKISLRSVRNNIYKLIEQGLIDYIKLINIRDRYFFLKEKGNNFIGSSYAVANDPFYNLNHFIEIGNNMLNAITIARNHEGFHSIETEQHLFFELRDKTDFENQRTLGIPDFTFSFYTQKFFYRQYFEIELTMKSRNRYYGEIFPFYSDQLKEYTNDYLIYVTTNESILSKLKIIQKDMLSRSSKYESLERMFIINQEHFNIEYKELMNKFDPTNLKNRNEEK